MDFQQFELMMNTILKLSESGSSAFYVWLFLDKGLSFVLYMTFIGLVYKISTIVEGYVTAETLLKDLRDTLKIGSRGMLVSSERAELYEKLHALCFKHAEEQKVLK